ncbi:general substrate transporter [Lipomyces starkeyi]|uniref:Major facilitator superfamily (MFS) profile domain-containing protein n=1 Tax=Lipomyces starkeyi NRRL Y-11557 TaxID=675824 RepID=A0A1E3Q2M5_LIPST|nr:hypothetical protein LIPSTDRAFT_29063 [Lipomyces starkeyi NRRL Y-11557]
MLIAGRAIAGLCIGLTSTLVTIYQSEISPRKLRGRIAGLQAMASTSGIMIQYFIDHTFYQLVLFALFAAVVATKGRWDEVLRVLAFLRTANDNANDPLVIAEYREIKDQIRSELATNSNSFHELFSQKIRKRLFLSMAMQMWSQLSGINVLLYYTVYVLHSAGIANVRLASSITYIINFVMAVPFLLWIDRWGRRPSLLIGALVMSFWHFLIGGLLMQYGEPNPVANEQETWIVVGHTAPRLPCLGAPITWLYPAEIAPVRVRVKTVALAGATNWASNLALGFGAPPLMRSIRWRVFFLFGAFNIMAFIHVLLALPETKQRTLEEMDEIFDHGEPLWKTFRAKGDTDRLDKLAKDIELCASVASNPET